MRITHVLPLVICLCCWVAVAGADAYAWPEKLLLAQAAGLSQDDAAAKVREETGGRVLDVQTGTQDGLAVYFVKVLLPDGRIRLVTVSSQ
jgi:uncharacterized membrane protein YkoI